METGFQHPAARIVGFIDHLRLNGFKLGPAECAQTGQILAERPLTTAAQTRSLMKVLLTGRREEWERFDELFEAYWFQKGRCRQGFDQPSSPRKSIPRAGHGLWQNHLEGGKARKDEGSLKAHDGGPDEKAEKGRSGRLIASRSSALESRDLRELSDPQEIAAAEKLAYDLARSLAYRLSRRYLRNTHGERLDFRRTIRKSLSYGGEPFRLIRKKRPDRPVRIVAFLDVSGSMKPYSRFFLQFLKGLVCQTLQADAYLFHTRLVRVTKAMSEKNTMRAMTQLSLLSEGFGGGTKLGESLKSFNRSYAKASLNSRSVVIIMSDGYDTGAPELLAEELAKLKRRTPRLVWLNPLLGWRNYEAVTAAMTAARPFIDHFAAANNLASLTAIKKDLARL